MRLISKLCILIKGLKIKDRGSFEKSLIYSCRVQLASRLDIEDLLNKVFENRQIIIILFTGFHKTGDAEFDITR